MMIMIMIKIKIMMMIGGADDMIMITKGIKMKLMMKTIRRQ